MTKGERLIWDLFMKFRELMLKLDPTADNTEWATRWAAVFHEMEQPAPHPPPLETKSPEPEHLAQPDADDDDDDAPHVRAAPKRKR
jgi:hypothetical protein